MSNEKPGENPGRRIPGAGSSARGQPDPKARPKGVVDGHRVNIPEPGRFRKGSQKKRPMGLLDSPAGRACPPPSVASRCLEKPRRHGLLVRTKTDTGGMVQKYQGAREKPR